jgi:hypothetical protein
MLLIFPEMFDEWREQPVLRISARRQFVAAGTIGKIMIGPRVDARSIWNNLRAEPAARETDYKNATHLQPAN